MPAYAESSARRKSIPVPFLLIAGNVFCGPKDPVEK